MATCPVCDNEYRDELSSPTCSDCQFCADEDGCTVNEPCAPCRYWMRAAAENLIAVKARIGLRG